jgi:hypothetical protein
MPHVTSTKIHRYPLLPTNQTSIPYLALRFSPGSQSDTITSCLIWGERQEPCCVPIMEQRRSTSRPLESAEDEQPRNHSRTGPRRDVDRLGEHERSIGGADSGRARNPFGSIASSNGVALLAHKDSTRRGPHEPNGAATATHATERSVSTTARDPDATEIGSVRTSGASGERIPVAPGTPSGALAAATAARSWRTRTARDEAPGTKRRSNGDAPTEHSVSSSASAVDAVANGPVSTSEHRGMRIPIAPGTPSGPLPAATAARSLAREESTRRAPANHTLEQWRRARRSTR